MPVCQMPLGRRQTVKQNTICGQHNGMATARGNTGQNTDRGHTPSPRIEIKISDPAGNRTRVARLEGKDYRPRHCDGHKQSS